MRNTIAIIAAVTILAFSTASSAFADSGNFTANSGESCSWYGFGTSISMQCSGYSRTAGGYVNYSCDLDYVGSMMSYRCRSIDGATWSGSR